MVFAVTSWQAAPGKETEAWAWAKEAMAFTNKTYGANTHVTRNVFAGPGQGGRITFIGTFDSIAAFDEFKKKRHADPNWKKYSKVHTLLVPSTYTSTIYEEA